MKRWLTLARDILVALLTPWPVTLDGKPVCPWYELPDLWTLDDILKRARVIAGEERA